MSAWMCDACGYDEWSPRYLHLHLIQHHDYTYDEATRLLKEEYGYDYE